MSEDRIFFGVILVVIGVAGLLVKIERYRVKRQSYTGHPLRWGPYLIIIAGILIIIKGFSDLCHASAIKKFLPWFSCLRTKALTQNYSI